MRRLGLGLDALSYRCDTSAHQGAETMMCGLCIDLVAAYEVMRRRGLCRDDGGGPAFPTPRPSRCGESRLCNPALALCISCSEQRVHHPSSGSAFRTGLRSLGDAKCIRIASSMRARERIGGRRTRHHHHQIQHSHAAFVNRTVSQPCLYLSWTCAPVRPQAAGDACNSGAVDSQARPLTRVRAHEDIAGWANCRYVVYRPCSMRSTKRPHRRGWGVRKKS